MATLPEGISFNTNIRYVEAPTRTFMVDWSTGQILGMDDGLEAMRQAVDILLHTERFRWQIYTSNYGVELEDLVGEEYDYIVSEIPRRVEEAFSVDSRIQSAENFVFSENQKGTMTCSFDVVTVFGTFVGEVKL